jgi:hypothetical protein
MWIEQIDDFHANNKGALDMNRELHLSIYVKEILKPKIIFSLSDDKLLIKDIEEDKSMSFDDFYYWWNIDRFDEVLSEEEVIFNDFNTLKSKVLPAIENIKQPEIKDYDSQEDKKKKELKIKSNNEKILKLQEHVKSEADKSNSQINILRQFRGLYPTKDSLKVFTENVIVLLNHTE